MQEYWVNVYGFGLTKLYGKKSLNMDDVASYHNDMVVYRIHVKMKVKKVSIVKPKYERPSKHWMEY